MTTALDVTLRAPYKGLAPFDESDTDAMLFFGRKKRLIDYASCAG